MVVRARYLLAATSAAVVLRLVVACSTSAEPAAVPEAGPPGEAFTACEIQGYVSESEGGLCPEGTCSALAFDTNGARVPCCTSIEGGAAMCVDAGGGEPLDATEAEAAADGADASEADPDAEAGAEGSAEAGGDGAASEAGPSPDAADGE